MRYDRECLYDVAWQELRVSMLNSWTTMESVKLNLYVLARYHEAGALAGDSYERSVRISNYLAAIMLGYGNKPEWVEQKALISTKQKYYSNCMFAYSLPQQPWDWGKVQEDLKKVTLGFLSDLYMNLKRRVYTSTKRTGGTQHRPELMKFMELLTAEFNNRGVKP